MYDSEVYGLVNTVEPVAIEEEAEEPPTDVSPDSGINELAGLSPEEQERQKQEWTAELAKRAIWILASLHTRESCRQAFQELKILTVVNLYILEAVTYVHLKSPDEVMTGAQQHDYNTQHAANYHLPAHRLASTEKKPTYVGAKLWNALPLELKRRDRLQFGHKLKLWLQDHPFYTINEFLNRTF
ncbi:hypothetical protein J6590_012604 [Homalodisca vitripennis]|nr:hypothetical protein J6590_012604 [Homalodisca vitripennis]